MKFKRYIFGSLLIAGLFFLGSCQDEMTTEDPKENNTQQPNDEDMVDVTLHLTLDPVMTLKTRDGDETVTTPIYGLENLDLFIYVLRDETDKILYQYGKGFVGFESTDVNDLIDSYPAFRNYVYEEDNNQTLMKVKWEVKEDGPEGSSGNVSYVMDQTITLRVMRGTVFKFSCWVQSTQSTAYNFNYLTALKVNYGEMMANSEVNDAFCATSIFSIGQMDTQLSVMLTRPFAQINIAIDEKTLDEKNKDVPIGNNDNDYKYSKIKLNGIVRAFDVIKNKVWTPDNIILYRNKKNDPDSPYANYSDKLFSDIPNAEDVISSFELPYSPLPGFEKDNSGGLTGKLQELEIFDFSNWGGGDVPKKSYKKLAMAYVLVPDAESDNSNDENISFIELESFKIAKDEEGTGELTHAPKEGDTEQPLKISVKRNWRTNLLYTDWEWSNQEVTPQPTPDPSEGPTEDPTDEPVDDPADEPSGDEQDENSSENPSEDE